MRLRHPSRSGGKRDRQTCLQPDPDDATLAAAARADPRAFTVLYERYLGPIYRYCFARLGNREAAEDATSAIFLKALAALPEYRDGGFAAWLFQIAHNVVVDLVRRQRPTVALGESAAAVKLLRFRALGRLRTLLSTESEIAPREVPDA